MHHKIYCILSFVITLSLISGNLCQGRVVIQNVITNSCTETKENVSDPDVEAPQFIISEANNGLFNIGEKPGNAYNIISIVRLLPTNTSFNMLHIKHIVKNQFSVSGIVFSIYHSQKLCNGYYTHGFGNLRI